VLVLFALSAIFLVGIAGTAVDAGMGYRQQQVQANAAAAAARGATVYLSENKATASDAQVKCVVTLYASAAEYQGLVAGSQCLAVSNPPDNQGFVEFANPVKGRTGAWYVDFSGNELIAVGSVNSALPVAAFLQSTYGYQVAGIRVYSAVDSQTYFMRALGISHIWIVAAAAYRAGAVNTFTPGTPLNTSVPKPGGGTQTGVYTFPASFSMQSFRTAGLQNPANNPTVTNFSANDGTAGFYWSSLQCQSMSNNDTKSWLQPTNPCPAAGPGIAATGAPNSACVNGGPGPTSCISTQPGIRAVDYRLSDPYVGTVIIVPIVQDASSETQNAIVQFAYFYFTGYSARGANGSISGYFIDPATMPVIPGPIGSGPGPGGVGGL
jgi:hypothetical protein